MSKSINNRPVLNSRHLIKLVQASPSGIIKRQQLNSRWQKVARAIRQAKKNRQVGTHDNFIYDPNRLDRDGVIAAIQQNGSDTGLPDFAVMVRDTLVATGVPAMVSQDIENSIGDYFRMEFIADHDFEHAGVCLLELRLFQPYRDWYYLASLEYETAYDYAISEAEKRYELDWLKILDWTGDEMRQGAQDGESARIRALARLYSRSQADSMLDMTERVFRLAERGGYLQRITCPDGAKRMRAADVHRLRDDPALRQEIEDQMDINIWQIRNLTDLKISYLKTLLHNEGIKPTSRVKDDGAYAQVWYRWGDIRGVLWPQGDHPSMSDVEIIEETSGAGRQAWWSDRIIEIHEEIEEKKRRQREARDRRRRDRREKRDSLRTQMIDNFPSWLREDEADQIAYIHVGPTNSGKTHDSLIELANAGSGWYLAPLRLLAREMFERLNRMGALCNLLTGEERIDVPGAKITAATVEMFNPERSGDCIIIDEAHMIADDQRGWAWTQALVNARAPHLRIITAPYGL
ncbi:MAG TPA: DEAD/DEAH box helicase, partial [Aggregatilineales bacterium]|nr:DEAD/DEAH box helicase [Aggregatilineales bacterium]